MARQRPAGRERLDQLLVQRGLAPTRAKAQALLLAGRVSSEGQRLDKAGTRVRIDIPLEVSEGRRWVGRGAVKLLGAVKRLGLSIEGRPAMDVGSSTGGFTQVLLELGAPSVIAIDVGRGQLDWSLRQDPRVHLFEGVNARHLEAGHLPHPPQLVTIDVSFISLRLILPPTAACLDSGGEIVALVKPQFEVGRGSVGRGGIVREAELHQGVLEQIIAFSRRRDWGIMGVCASHPRGADGNREFFLQLRPDAAGLDPETVSKGVQSALEDAMIEATSGDGDQGGAEIE